MLRDTRPTRDVTIKIKQKIGFPTALTEDLQMESHAEANSLELEAKRKELIKTRQEIKISKDRSTQSWLHSKPLADELEKLNSDLESAKNPSSTSDLVISDLQSQLESMNMSIKLRKAEEVKAKMKITEINLALDQTRDEMENLKMETNEEQRVRSKLKKDLRLKRQSFRTLQLTLRAIRIETEAFGASAAEALEYIKRSEVDETKMELTYEEYQALTRKVKEETSRADWRVSVSMEQKLDAEASRNSALRRLKELRSRNRSRRRTGEENVTREENIVVVEEEEPDLKIKPETQEVNNKQIAFPTARAEVISRKRPRSRRFERSESNARSGKKKKKKSSIFQQIKSFLLRGFTRLFG